MSAGSKTGSISILSFLGLDGELELDGDLGNGCADPLGSMDPLTKASASIAKPEEPWPYLCIATQAHAADTPQSWAPSATSSMAQESVEDLLLLLRIPAEQELKLLLL